MNRKWTVTFVVVLAGCGLLISEVWPAEPVELITEDQISWLKENL